MTRALAGTRHSNSRRASSPESRAPPGGTGASTGASQIGFVLPPGRDARRAGDAVRLGRRHAVGPTLPAPVPSASRRRSRWTSSTRSSRSVARCRGLRRRQYRADAHPFFVMLSGRPRASANFPEPPFPNALLRGGARRLQRGLGPPPDRDRFRRGPGGARPRLRTWRRPDGPPPLGRETDHRRRRARRASSWFLPRAPFGFLLRRYAPTLAPRRGGRAGRRHRRGRAADLGPGRAGGCARSKTRRGAWAAAISSARARRSAAATKWRRSRAPSTPWPTICRRARSALAASDRARRQLLADVSHELTTPVTAMRGYLETLTMPELALDEATRARYLASSATKPPGSSGIIGDLLDLARLEAAAARSSSTTCRSQQLFAASPRVTSGTLPEAGVRCRAVDRPGRGARARRSRTVSNRRCRTWPPTRFAMRRADRRSSCAQRADGDAIALTVERSRARDSAGAPAARLRSLLQGATASRHRAACRTAAASGCRS